jgi:hypothetical protein
MIVALIVLVFSVNSVLPQNFYFKFHSKDVIPSVDPAGFNWPDRFNFDLPLTDGRARVQQHGLMVEYIYPFSNLKYFNDEVSR